MAQVAAVTAEYEQLRRRCPRTGAPDDPVARVRWMIEELRVGLFAQSIGTPRPVSEQRVYKAIDRSSSPEPCRCGRRRATMALPAAGGVMDTWVRWAGGCWIAAGVLLLAELAHPDALAHRLRRVLAADPVAGPPRRRGCSR